MKEVSRPSAPWLSLFCAVLLASIFSHNLFAEDIQAGNAQPKPTFTFPLTHGTLEVYTIANPERVGEEFIWTKPDGQKETIYEEFRGGVGAFQPMGIEAAYDMGESVALIRSGGNGILMYWRIDKDSAGWRLTAIAVLDSGTLIDSLKFSAIDTVQTVLSPHLRHTYQISKEPRSGNRLYKKVFKDGVEYEMPGFYLGSETASGAKAAAKPSPNK